MSDQARLPVETPREWLRYAEGDFSVAEREAQSETPVYHTVCFLCQSAAEKFLKGYLIAQGWTLEKTHDILKLLKTRSSTRQNHRAHHQNVLIQPQEDS